METSKQNMCICAELKDLKRKKILTLLDHVFVNKYLLVKQKIMFKNNNKNKTKKKVCLQLLIMSTAIAIKNCL